MSGIWVIVVFIFALINIILLFKIWGMTNNVDWISRQVDKITEQVDKPRYEAKFADYYLSGEYEEAYRLLNHYLADEIHIEYDNLSSDDKESKQKYNKAIARIIDEYKPFYELLGKNIPDNIKNVTYELSQILYDS